MVGMTLAEFLGFRREQTVAAMAALDVTLDAIRDGTYQPEMKPETDAPCSGEQPGD